MDTEAAALRDDLVSLNRLLEQAGSPRLIEVLKEIIARSEARLHDIQCVMDGASAQREVLRRASEELPAIAAPEPVGE
jgi:hypothetical protein